MLRWLTAGESHGPALVAILEGLPAGVQVTTADVDRDLARRRLGAGRGARMKFEQDQVRVLGGVLYIADSGDPHHVRVFDVTKKAVVYEKRIDDFSFPADSAIPTTDRSEAQFRGMFIQVLGQKISRLFYAHESREHFAEESRRTILTSVSCPSCARRSARSHRPPYLRLTRYLRYQEGLTLLEFGLKHLR